MISTSALQKLALSAVLAVITTISVVAQNSAANTTTSSTTVHQLRIYEIFDGNKKAFHERFRDHATRIMAKYDFKIVAIWESRKDDRTEFVYLLEWPDAAAMKDGWAKFMADKEWAEIKKETGGKNGPMVGDIADRTLELTDYSPRRTLLNK